MRKYVFFMIPVALLALCLMTGCNNSRKSSQRAVTTESTLQDMVDIDEIAEIESIIADSTLENADGDPSWKKEGSRMIRIRKNGKFYLRMKSRDGSTITTTLTYRYDK